VPRGGVGETILLVEDELGVRALAERLLRRTGYRVLVAADGPAALEIAAREPRIDLLFTDVVLPKGMNGRQIARALALSHPAMRVLYASGYSADIIQRRGELGPGLRFIAKPYEKEDLARAVRAALDEVTPGQDEENKGTNVA
jgi:CheY-like chemotaxis protein